MERSSGKEDENPYKLLDLIPTEREYHVRRRSSSGHGSSSDEKKLELRLGLPGDEEEDYWSKESNKNGLQVVGLGNYLATAPAPAPWGYAKESSSHLCCTPPPPAATDMKNKAFSPPSASNTAVPNSSHKRAAPAAVVGWPPIRSFRKNLASGSSAKAVPDPPTAKPVEKPTENCQKGLFVKINMDGVPIGRKVDLSAYDSYGKLCSAVALLFRGLLAAQREACAGGSEKKQVAETAITGLLDGSGEYSLVYEDNEGDSMLAGDVPWHMFVSTVKRLRVLKSSEVSTLSRVRGKGRMLSSV